MPIPEPTGAFGLWPRVRALSGWPESNEDVVRALADDWRGAHGLFATAGAYRVGGQSWTDEAGQAFVTRATGTLAKATTSAEGMSGLADRTNGYAEEVAGVKTGITALINDNLAPFAAMLLLPPGVREAADAMFVGALAGSVRQLMTAAAGRAGASPADNRRYWDSLGFAEQQRLIREQPEMVGGTDGFPATARDQANRLLMARARTDLTAELAEVERRIAESPRGPGNASEDRKLFERRREIHAELFGIGQIEQRLGRGDHYLLGFDLNGPGRDATAIVAAGNPDHAANVATYVPGAESSFAQMDRLLGDNDAMSAAAGPGSSVIMWLGYDAPPTVMDAVDESYARGGQDALVRFQEGLRATHTGPPSHNTVVGHSYGSVVAGYAARDHGLPVDDFLAVGSPGTGVNHASELRLPPGHVYVMEDNGDPVADIGETGWYGADPGDDAFGARQLRADDEPPRPSDDYSDPVGAHLGYFRTEPALDNIGDVIANRPTR